jgi:acetate kinase
LFDERDEVPNMIVLVFNAGSATLKFALFDAAGGPAAEVRGLAEQFGPNARLRYGDSSSTSLPLADHAAAADEILRRALRERRLSTEPIVVAHRVVHGGGRYHAPLCLSPERLDALERYIPLAPLHMGPALAVARRAMERLGADAMSVAVFDTAFFHDLPPVAREIALPREWVERFGLRRFGFHGLAHRSLFEQYLSHTRADAATARVVTLQLGRGCSAAPIARGAPIDTSMGLTPLEGLVMGTRVGDVDAGVLLHLLREGISLEALDDALQHRSGLLGLSGASADMRELLDLERRGHAGAQLAIDAFCARVSKYVGAYLARLGGADAVVLGGGIAEHAAEIRRRCLCDFAWAGLTLDEARNARGEPGRISTANSRLQAYVFAVDEERVIANDARAALNARDTPG